MGGGITSKNNLEVFTQHSTLYLLQPDQNFLMKVKVEDLEGLLTQKHGMIVMKVKVEDLEVLGGQSSAGQRTGL